jgi:hypothetical protein
MPAHASNSRYRRGWPHDPHFSADELTMKTKLRLVVVEDSVADAELLERHLARAGLD